MSPEVSSVQKSKTSLTHQLVNIDRLFLSLRGNIFSFNKKDIQQPWWIEY